MRSLTLVGMLAATVVFLPGPLAVQAQSPAPGTSVAGAWTRNKDLSDAPTERGQQGDDNGGGRGDSGGGSGGGGGRRRGGGGGGGGYGGRGGGSGRVSPQANPEDMARMRDAMRD